ERRRLQDFIKTHVRWGDRGQTLYAIELGRIRPSKSLADALAGLMKGKSEFVLITQARKVSENGKHVLIVEGGPGTPSALL
ncbi:MAG: ATP-binding protein, partial [Pseudohongiella sp.]|nr:ATP-binding protein [Pseudohongiella sp.]